MLANESEDTQFAARFPLRILVADHDYIGRRTLTLKLAGLGYRAESVENGGECLAAAVKGHFDLIILEIDLPVLNGIECSRCIRDEKVKTSLVAVSPLPSALTRLECLGAGINGYLEKPIALEQLKQALRVAFANQHAKAA